MPPSQALTLKKILDPFHFLDSATELCGTGAGGGALVSWGEGAGHLAPFWPEWLDPEDNWGAVKRFQLGLHYSLIYCDRPPRLAVTALLPVHFSASSFRISLRV